MQVGTASAAAWPSSSSADRASAASPGLVPSKTSGPKALVALDPWSLATRRIKGLKCAVWLAGKLHELNACMAAPGVCWFVTLTYVGVDDWRPQHISGAIRRFRKWCRREAAGCRYVWVAELQQRGAVHYHLLAWLPPGLKMPHWDLDRGRGTWWPHGMTNTQPAVAGIGYLMKYLSKLGEFHRFPKNLRLYGIGGLPEFARAIRSWHSLPEWVKREHGVGDVARKELGLTVLATGEVLDSPWKAEFVPNGLSLTLKRELPERFHDGPYSTWPRPEA